MPSKPTDRQALHAWGLLVVRDLSYRFDLQDDTVLELLEDGAMFTLGNDSQYPDWEGMWKHELSRDDTKKPKGLYLSGLLM